MSCVSGSDEREIWIAKQDVTLWKFRAREKPMSMLYKKGTQFRVRKSQKVTSPHSTFWKFEPASGCGGFTGYASRFYFYRRDFEIPDEEQPWFFGKVSRIDAKEYLMSDLNPDGAYLIRVGATKSFVLSLKFRDNKDNQFKVADYRIKRTDPENYRGKYYLEETKLYDTLGGLVNGYLTEQRGLIRTNMTDICFIPKPDTDDGFRTALAILNDADTWTITKQEIVQGEELGSGNFGTVTKGMLRGTIPVAIKTLNENKNDKKKRADEFNKAKKDFEKETQIMKKLNHPNLVKIYGIQMDSFPFQLVMEQCEKALKNHLEKYRVEGRKPTLDKDQPDCPTFGDLKDWCEQIALGMIYLESKKVIHRDLAARNVLLSKHNRAKIADFGLSYEENDADDDAQFPVLWTAPEIVNRKRRDGRRERKKFSHKSDVWSFGITMKEIFSFGEKPYKEFRLARPGEVKNILKERKTMQAPKEYFDDDMSNKKVKEFFKEIIMSCWEFEPHNRPSFQIVYSKITDFEQERLSYM